MVFQLDCSNSFPEARGQVSEKSGELRGEGFFRGQESERAGLYLVVKI